MRQMQPGSYKGPIGKGLLPTRISVLSLSFAVTHVLVFFFFSFFFFFSTSIPPGSSSFSSLHLYTSTFQTFLFFLPLYLQVLVLSLLFTSVPQGSSLRLPSALYLQVLDLALLFPSIPQGFSLSLLSTSIPPGSSLRLLFPLYLQVLDLALLSTRIPQGSTSFSCFPPYLQVLGLSPLFPSKPQHFSLRLLSPLYLQILVFVFFPSIPPDSSLRLIFPSIPPDSSLLLRSPLYLHVLDLSLVPPPSPKPTTHPPDLRLQLACRFQIFLFSSHSLPKRQNLLGLTNRLLNLQISLSCCC